MNWREPHWWYEPRPNGIARLLSPVAQVYGAIARRRIEQTRPYRSNLPVICAGNLTAGGTGKTPLTRELAARLTARGQRPAILTRGYGGRLAGPHWIDTGSDRPALVGDEPLLLARSAPTLLARDRAAGAAAIEATGRFTHILLDDGLQNPALAKSLRFAVVDGRRGFGNGRVMPAGPLRAPLAFQLAMVDAFVVNHGFKTTNVEPTAVGNWLAGNAKAPVLQARIAPVDDVNWLQAQPVVAFAGIGVPEHFFRMLRDLGAHVVAVFPFVDHRMYSDADAAGLLAAAWRHQARLVTTEKDLVRLDRQQAAQADLADATRTVAIRMTLPPDDSERLDTLLASKHTS